MVPLEPGDFIGPTHQVEELLDSAGSTAIYRCRHVLQDVREVVKVLDPRLAEDGRVRDAFRNMARVSGRLQHPVVVPMRELLLGGELVAHVMPSLQGESLEHRLARTDGLLPRTEALEIGLRVAQALEHGHARGQVHGELLPSHVFLEDRDGGYPAVRVLDFGIDRLRQALLARGRRDDGLPLHYLSPEVLGRQERATAASDLFSFGVLLHELLTGWPPFRGDTPEELLAAMDARIVEPPDLQPPEPQLSDLVARCLERQEEARPPIDSLLGALTRARQATGAPLPPSRVATPSPRDSAHRPTPPAESTGLEAPISSSVSGRSVQREEEWEDTELAYDPVQAAEGPERPSWEQALSEDAALDPPSGQLIVEHRFESLYELSQSGSSPAGETEPSPAQEPGGEELPLAAQPLQTPHADAWSEQPASEHPEGGFREEPPEDERWLAERADAAPDVEQPEGAAPAPGDDRTDEAEMQRLAAQVFARYAPPALFGEQAPQPTESDEPPPRADEPRPPAPRPPEPSLSAHQRADSQRPPSDASRDRTASDPSSRRAASLALAVLLGALAVVALGSLGLVVYLIDREPLLTEDAGSPAEFNASSRDGGVSLEQELEALERALRQVHAQRDTLLKESPPRKAAPEAGEGATSQREAELRRLLEAVVEATPEPGEPSPTPTVPDDDEAAPTPTTPSPAAPSPPAPYPAAPEDGDEGSGIGGAALEPDTAATEEDLPPGASEEHFHVYQRVQAHSAEIRGCYEQALVTAPRLRGRLDLAFQVGESGRPRRVRARMSPERFRPLERCVRKRVRAWRFPPHGGEPLHVRVPFLLGKPSEQ